MTYKESKVDKKGYNFIYYRKINHPHVKKKNMLNIVSGGHFRRSFLGTSK